MTARPFNVLFLCTGNSARSIIAESLLNAQGAPRFKAYSAGSRPGGHVNPLVVELLASRGIATESARSKSWDEFAAPDAPIMDLVITVCDQAAGEPCPIWPGHPARAHWIAPDPAAHRDDPDAARRVVLEVYHLMQARIRLLMSLPLDTLDRQGIEREVRGIGAGAPT